MQGTRTEFDARFARLLFEAADRAMRKALEEEGLPVQHTNLRVVLKDRHSAQAAFSAALYRKCVAHVEASLPLEYSLLASSMAIACDKARGVREPWSLAEPADEGQQGQRRARSRGTFSSTDESIGGGGGGGGGSGSELAPSPTRVTTTSVGAAPTLGMSRHITLQPLDEEAETATSPVSVPSAGVAIASQPLRAVSPLPHRDDTKRSVGSESLSALRAPAAMHSSLLAPPAPGAASTESGTAAVAAPAAADPVASQAQVGTPLPALPLLPSLPGPAVAASATVSAPTVAAPTAAPTAAQNPGVARAAPAILARYNRGHQPLPRLVVPSTSESGSGSTDQHSGPHSSSDSLPQAHGSNRVEVGSGQINQSEMSLQMPLSTRGSTRSDWSAEASWRRDTAPRDAVSVMGQHSEGGSPTPNPAPSEPSLAPDLPLLGTPVSPAMGTRVHSDRRGSRRSASPAGAPSSRGHTSSTQSLPRADPMAGLLALERTPLAEVANTLYSPSRKLPWGWRALWNAARDRRTLRVLVVEDQPMNRKIMQRKVISARMPFRVEVEAVEDGLQGALAYARALGAAVPEGALPATGSPQSRPFDLVLMDLQMPKVDGFGSTRRIRAIEERIARYHGARDATHRLGAAPSPDAQQPAVDGNGIVVLPSFPRASGVLSTSSPTPSATPPASGARTPVRVGSSGGGSGGTGSAGSGEAEPAGSYVYDVSGHPMEPAGGRNTERWEDVAARAVAMADSGTAVRPTRWWPTSALSRVNPGIGVQLSPEEFEKLPWHTWCGAPVIAVSAHRTGTDATQIRLSGMDGSVPKPMEDARLALVLLYAAAAAEQRDQVASGLESDQAPINNQPLYVLAQVPK